MTRRVSGSSIRRQCSPDLAAFRRVAENED